MKEAYGYFSGDIFQPFPYTEEGLGKCVLAATAEARSLSKNVIIYVMRDIGTDEEDEYYICTVKH